MIARGATDLLLPYVGPDNIWRGYSGENVIYDGLPRAGLVDYWELISSQVSGGVIVPKIGVHSLTPGRDTAGDAWEPTVGTNATEFAGDYLHNDALTGFDMGSPWTAYLWLCSGSGIGYIWNLHDPDNAAIFYAIYRNNDTGVVLSAKDGATTYNTSRLAFSTSATTCLVVTRDGTNHYLQRMDTGASVQKAGFTATCAPRIDIGSLVESAPAPDLTMAICALYSGAHSQAQKSNVYRYILRRGGALLPPFSSPNLILFDGDSLTIQNKYPLAVYNGLDGDWEMVNHGTWGAGWTDLINEGSSVDVYYIPSRTNNILCVLAGVNDDEDPAETTYPKIVAYCEARKAVGWTVVIGSVSVDCTATEAQETNRQTLNASIATNYASYADAFADYRADTHIGNAAWGVQDPTYWSDRLHLTDAGYALLATYFETAVESLL